MLTRVPLLTSGGVVVLDCDVLKVGVNDKKDGRCSGGLEMVSRMVIITGYELTKSHEGRKEVVSGCSFRSEDYGCSVTVILSDDVITITILTRLRRVPKTSLFN